jgi:hypothetical protein
VHVFGTINSVDVRILFFYLLSRPTNAFVGVDNKLYKMHGTYIKIVEAQQARSNNIYFSILLLPTPLSTAHNLHLCGLGHFFPALIIIFIFTNFPANNSFNEIYFFRSSFIQNSLHFKGVFNYCNKSEG